VIYALILYKFHTGRR
ncbi:hypothetical protein PybrP1_000197, partial [[Pythium] brassicae (nom. inval.)]